MKTNFQGLSIVVLCGCLIQMGCGLSNAVKGGAIGAGAGGVVGGVIGDKAGNTAAGAIIGATVGGTAGVLIGRHMDKQAEEMRKTIADAEIERVAEGIKITFDSGILFAIGSADLQAPARATIEKMVRVLKDYPDSNILIEGDTDNTGSTSLNQELSERRAMAVADYHKMLGISGTRISTIGMGELNPIASNDTAAGRQQNRRVEVAIFANDALKTAAANGTLK